MPSRIVIHRAGRETSLALVTAIADAPLGGAGELREFFGRLADALLSAGIAPVHEKVYGTAEAAERVAGAWRDAYRDGSLDPAGPLSYVANAPCVGGALAGVQVLGVAGASAPVPRTLFEGGVAVGREVNVGDRRLVVLAGSHGDRPLGPPGDQLRGMFESAERRLRSAGLGFGDVARTWIHVEQLLPWYEELNRVRTAFYRRTGLLEGGDGRLPASTGIQGAHPGGGGCQLEVLALEGPPGQRQPPFRAMRTERQGGAWDYGSAFSRGSVVRLGDDRLLLASGTASIDGAGETVHVGDPEGQIRETYAAVGALWSPLGHDWGAVGTAVLFFKDADTLAVWRGLRRDGQLPDIPAIPVFADVCREELLFELEATGLV